MARDAVSGDGKYYAAISQDGRLKIWDTETNVLKQEYTPDLHLSAPPTCLVWLLVSATAETKSGAKRKSSACENEIHCVVLGTKRGKVLIYNVPQAKVETVLETKFHDGIPILALEWTRKYGLFSVNKSNVLYEWDIENSRFRHKYELNDGGTINNDISAITFVPQNLDASSKYVVTSSYQMHLWRLSSTSSATLLKTLGHGVANEIRTVSLGQTCYLLHSSRDERLLSVWDITIKPEMMKENSGKKQRKQSVSENLSAPLYNFLLEDAPSQVDVFIEDGVTPKLNLCAVTRSGVLHYYGLFVNGGTTKPMKPTITVHITTGDAMPLNIKCCQISRNSTEFGEVLVGYDFAQNKFVFERVVLDPNQRTQVIIRGDKSKKSKTKKSKKDEANKMLNSKENVVAYVEPVEAVPRKRVAPGAELEVPMEERLSNLAIDLKSRSKAAINQNLTKLLVQGLHSKDKSIILTVLQKDDPLVAKMTLSNLPPDYIAPFIEYLSEMATKTTSQMSTVCTWLTALVQCQSSLLLATLNTEATSQRLALLLAILTQRRSNLCQLLNLKGRLELTMSQKAQSHDVEETPVLEYDDTASDEDMDVDKHSSTSTDELYFESDADCDTDRNGDINSGSERDSS